jgi:hypothetical protein
VPAAAAARSVHANMPDMPELTRRIATSTYRYKRPPREKAKADAPPGPIIVSAKRGRPPAS